MFGLIGLKSKGTQKLLTMLNVWQLQKCIINLQRTLFLVCVPQSFICKKHTQLNGAVAGRSHCNCHCESLLVHACNRANPLADSCRDIRPIGHVASNEEAPIVPSPDLAIDTTPNTRTIYMKSTLKPLRKNKTSSSSERSSESDPKFVEIIWQLQKLPTNQLMSMVFNYLKVNNM